MCPPTLASIQEEFHAVKHVAHVRSSMGLASCAPVLSHSPWSARTLLAGHRPSLPVSPPSFPGPLPMSLLPCSLPFCPPLSPPSPTFSRLRTPTACSLEPDPQALLRDKAWWWIRPPERPQSS